MDKTYDVTKIFWAPNTLGIYSVNLYKFVDQFSAAYIRNVSLNFHILS